MNAPASTTKRNQYQPKQDPVFIEASVRLQDRFMCYFHHADDGSGGDVTRNAKPLKTFSEWLDS
jgi:hypothetical protein